MNEADVVCPGMDHQDYFCVCRVWNGWILKTIPWSWRWPKLQETVWMRNSAGSAPEGWGSRHMGFCWSALKTLKQSINYICVYWLSTFIHSDGGLRRSWVLIGVLYIVLLQVLQHMKSLQEEADKERERRLLKEKGRSAHPRCTSSLRMQNTNVHDLSFIIFLFRTRKEERSEAEGERGPGKRSTEKEKGRGEGEEKEGVWSTAGCSGYTGTTEEEERGEEKESQPKSRCVTHHQCRKVESVMERKEAWPLCFVALDPVKEAWPWEIQAFWPETLDWC